MVSKRRFVVGYPADKPEGTYTACDVFCVLCGVCCLLLCVIARHVVCVAIGHGMGRTDSAGQLGPCFYDDGDVRYHT